MLPFTVNELFVKDGDYIFVPDIKKAVKDKLDTVTAYVINNEGTVKKELTLNNLTDDERDIILSGCLINYYKK